MAWTKAGSDSRWVHSVRDILLCMTAEMKNSLPERRDLQVREPVLRNKLATMELPPTMRSFARYSQGGLHLIGVESKQPKSDPLLVALPGFAHANWSYIDLIQALGREQIEITALSFPGDGESKPFEKSMEDLRADDYTNAAKTLLKEVGRPVILVGHSFGGLVAQKIADDEDVKNAIQGLVLINSVPPSSLRARNVPAAGGVFHPKDDMVWKERLFAGMDSPDREWWFRELDKAEASVAGMNDYVAGNAGGLLDPNPT